MNISGTYLLLLKRKWSITGFVLLLEVLENPWDLILNFKGAWKALEKKNFCWISWKWWKLLEFLFGWEIMYDCFKVIQGLRADFKIGDRLCKTCTVACWVKFCVAHIAFWDQFFHHVIRWTRRIIWLTYENLTVLEGQSKRWRERQTRFMIR